MELAKIQGEFQDYFSKGFKVVLTSDGSPTLLQEGLGEEMHARGGALSETEYVYINPLKEFIQKLEPKVIQVVSVGLGLGYLEVLSYLTAKEFDVSIKILSYEKEPSLIENFKERISHPQDFPEYFSIFGVESPENFCSSSFLDSIEWCGPFEVESIIQFYDVPTALMFDAYSNKTNPELWSQEFLTSVFMKLPLPSFIASYASTGSVNRALLASGFYREKRRGFLGKRECTLAFKE